MLSIIIPIDFFYREKEILNRTKYLLEKLRFENVKVVFGHNHRGRQEDFLFLSLISGYHNASVNSDRFYEGGINASLLRNRAFNKITTDNVCLLDIDIWPDYKLIKKYSDLLDFHDQPFFILPCLYLTRFGSRLIIKGRITKEDIIKKYFSFSRKEFLHIANPSSITIMKSVDYYHLNGFDEAYKGHGYEDFDFLIRLARLHNKLKVCKNFININKARSPLFVTGFRRALGSLSLPALLNKDIALHLYHNKVELSSYKKSRDDNFELFSSTHLNQCHVIDEWDSTLITEFIKLCNDLNYNIEDYSILFENKPGHIDRFDTFKRRLRFIING